MGTGEGRRLGSTALQPLTGCSGPDLPRCRATREARFQAVLFRCQGSPRHSQAYVGDALGWESDHDLDLSAPRRLVIHKAALSSGRKLA